MDAIDGCDACMLRVIWMLCMGMDVMRHVSSPMFHVRPELRRRHLIPLIDRLLYDASRLARTRPTSHTITSTDVHAAIRMLLTQDCTALQQHAQRHMESDMDGNT